MSDIRKKLKKLIKDDKTDELSIFIESKIKHGFFRKRNLNELIELLPVIMKYTNDKNADWLMFDELVLNGKNKFIHNISKIKYNKSLYLFNRVLNVIYFYNDLSEEEIDVVLNQVLNCDVQLSSSEIERLFNLYKKLDSVDMEGIIKNYLSHSNTCVSTAFYICYSQKKYINLVYDNIDLIVSMSNIDLFTFRRLFSSDKNIVKKIDDKINNNPYKYVAALVKDLYRNFFSENNLSDNKEFDTIIDVVYLILDDISKNEKVPLSGIDVISFGAYSVVLELGDKVIKIGKGRGTKKFPNNPYINAILLRKEFKINDNLSFFIEVNEKVDTKSRVSEEELYQLYKKLRDIGLLWTDIASRNVGRLLKDNSPKWRQELPITDEVIGLDKKRGTEQLKKGDVVILDNDFIYDENTSGDIIKYGSKNLNNVFNIRYSEEKNRHRRG